MFLPVFRIPSEIRILSRPSLTMRPLLGTWTKIYISYFFVGNYLKCSFKVCFFVVTCSADDVWLEMQNILLTMPETKDATHRPGENNTHHELTHDIARQKLKNAVQGLLSDLIASWGHAHIIWIGLVRCKYNRCLKRSRFCTCSAETYIKYIGV